MAADTDIAAGPPASPCTKICRLDPATQLCVGCWRHVREIAAWTGLSAEVRRRIVADLPRRAAEGCP